MIRKLALTLGAVASLASLASLPASADPRPQEEIGREARIPFADTHGIRDWRAVDEHTLYIQDRGFRWYLATFEGPCRALPEALTIGFRPVGIGTFDKYGIVETETGPCMVRSLVTSGPPPKKKAVARTKL